MQKSNGYHSFLLELSAHNIGIAAVGRINEKLAMPSNWVEPTWICWGAKDDIRTSHWRRHCEEDQVQLTVLRSGRKPVHAFALGDVLATVREELVAGGWRQLPWASALACARQGLWDVIKTAELVEAFTQGNRDPAGGLLWLGHRHKGEEEVERLLIRNYSNVRKYFG